MGLIVNSSPPSNWRSFAAAFVVSALVGLAAAPSWAQSAIRILVNDQPITSYDIQQRSQMLKVFTRGKQGEKAAIEQLVDERLMLQEAERRRVTISDEEVKAELADRARSAKLSPAQFEQAMRQAGFDPRTFTDFLRANMTWAKIVRSRFRATVNITEQDVAAALTGRDAPEETKTATEFLIQQIIFILPKNAGSGAEAQKRKEANAFRSAYQGCDHAVEQATGMSGVVVKPVVRREEGQLVGNLLKKIEALNVGDVSSPDRIDGGIELLALCAKNEIAGQTEASVEARQELTNERSQLLARRYLRDLRSDAVIEYR